MGKASRAKRDGTRQQRIAAQQAAARRAEIRNRVLIFSGIAVVVIAVVLSFVVVKMNAKSPAVASGVSNGPTGTALASVVTDTTSVPASTLDTVGAGSGVTGVPTKITGGTPLTSGGKPEVLYMGAEYCPFCAGERWALVVALSRFGSFSGLSTVHSSSTDQFPNTPTWTFIKSHYTSTYLTFSAVETQSNIPTSGGSYTTLQTPTSAQQALLTKYDAPPYVSSANAGAIPFVDFGNKYMLSGASYSPQVLQGKSWSQIASALKDPASPIAKAVDGTANYLTATICKLTGNQPASACTPVVKQLEAKF
jgi:Domain of unknown function (DUF929)